MKKLLDKSRKTASLKVESVSRKTEEANWQKARQQAAQRGIVLTRRKSSDGGYYCYLSSEAKKSLLFRLTTVH